MARCDFTIMSVTTLDGQALAAEIRRQTALANRNNVTRTQAYLQFYREHEEVHWALLAHLVSRNGGWNMTDLQGEWLPRIMDPDSRNAYFWFLERCNWLIFHDAYAQLLLYAEMKRSGRDLTNLLSSLHVSSFMQEFWQDFLTSGDSARLTRALIVNEQQYIEQRVVRKSFTYHRIFSTLAFFAQSQLSLNQTLFPYKAHPTDRRFQLVGMNVHDFPEINQRIAIGKTLYKLLYGDKKRLNSIREFAFRIPHTGSRADYWPHLFTPVEQAEREASVSDNNAYSLRLHKDSLREGVPKLYSPFLHKAWPDTSHDPADGVDWYRDPRWLAVVEEPSELPSIATEEYARALQWIDYGVKIVSLFS